MKHFAKLLCVIIMTGIAGAAFAQNLKFGHINLQEIVPLMTEYDSAEVKLKGLAKELEEQIKTMQLELQTKYETYQQKATTWSATILESKRKELEELQVRIQDFQQGAQQELQQAQNVGMTEVINIAKTAVEKIAKQDGYTFIFDTGTLLYFNPAQSTDITVLVKKALNITKEFPTRAN